MQKKVISHRELPDGFVGQLAEASPATSVGCINISDAANKIKPGDFLVGEVDNATKRYKYAKKAQGNIQNKAVLGVVLRNSQKNAGVIATDEIDNNSQVMYLTKGSTYIKATSDAQAGYFVLLKEADSSLVFDAAPTKASHLFTGFRVAQGGKTNDLIMIQSI